MNRVVTFASSGLIAAGLAIMPVAAFAQSGNPASGPAVSTAGASTTVTTPAPATSAKVATPAADAKVATPAVKGSAPASKEMSSSVAKDHGKGTDTKAAHPTTAGGTSGSTTGAKTGG